MALAHQGGGIVPLGKNFHLRAEMEQARGADVDRLQGAARKGCGLKPDGGIVLPAVGIALHGGVQHGKAGLRWIEDLAGKENGAGAGAEGRSFADKSVEQVVEAGPLQMLQEGGGLPPGMTRPSSP